MDKASLSLDDPADRDSAPLRHEPFSRDTVAAEREYTQLYNQFARSLLAFLAGRLPRAEVEDTAQAIWTRIWERRDSFQGGNFRAWMFEITRNYLIDQARKKRISTVQAEYEAGDSGRSDPLEILLDRERIGRMLRCLDKLDATMAELVRGRMRNESYDELAERLNLELQQAHRRVHMAKQRLQDCVNQGS